MPWRQEPLLVLTLLLCRVRWQDMGCLLRVLWKRKLSRGVRTDVPQSLSSTVPLFTCPYVSQSRCSPTLYSPVPMFPSPFLPRRGIRPMFPSLCVSQSLCFPVPMFPKDVPQSLCSPIPLFPSPDVPLRCFQSLCSPKMFPNPYVPQFPMFT